MLRILVVILLGSLLINVSHAEINMDIIGGSVRTAAADVTVEDSGWFYYDTTTRSVSFKDSQFAAFRTTWWNELNPSLGLAGEVSLHSVNDPDNTVDISMLTLAGEGLYRYRAFISDRYPYGRFQPYVGIGLFMVSARADVDFSPDVSPVSASGEKLATGILAGVRWLVAEKFALFFETRNVNIKVDAEDSYIFTNETVNTRLKSRFALFGISWEY